MMKFFHRTSLFLLVAMNLLLPMLAAQGNSLRGKGTSTFPPQFGSPTPEPVTLSLLALGATGAGAFAVSRGLRRKR